MATNIEHPGIVEKVTPTHVTVRIVQTSACSSCAVRGSCAAADSKEHVLEIVYEHSTLKVGDSVTVVGQVSMGLKAVMLAFGIPVVLVVLVQAIVAELTQSDSIVSATSLGIVAVWYLFIYLIRHKLAKQLTFYIKP